MGKLFDWLDRSKAEAVRDYDNRINHLQAFHAGYAFLSFENYYPELAGFAAYVVWNGEFNEKLENPMPAGGFMLHCDTAQAQQMCERPEGFPVFVKLYAKQGRLMAEHMVLCDAERMFDLYFNGCELLPPERLGLVFAGARVPKEAHSEEYMTEECRAAAPAAGSFRRRGSLGSYRGGSFHGIGGSYWLGSFVGGSYRAGALWSLWRSSYFSGSFANWREMFGSSYRSGSYRQWWGSYTQARLWTGSYVSGSFRAFFGEKGSYRSGSFRPAKFGSGSYRKSLFRKGSFLRNGSGIAFLMECREKQQTVPAETEETKEKQLLYADRGAAYRYARIIEEMGYGLDLI